MIQGRLFMLTSKTNQFLFDVNGDLVCIYEYRMESFDTNARWQPSRQVVMYDDGNNALDFYTKDSGHDHKVTIEKARKIWNVLVEQYKYRRIEIIDNLATIHGNATTPV